MQCIYSSVDFSQSHYQKILSYSSQSYLASRGINNTFNKEEKQRKLSGIHMLAMQKNAKVN